MPACGSSDAVTVRWRLSMGKSGAVLRKPAGAVLRKPTGTVLRKPVGVMLRKPAGDKRSELILTESQVKQHVQHSDKMRSHGGPILTESQVKQHMQHIEQTPERKLVPHISDTSVASAASSFVPSMPTPDKNKFTWTLRCTKCACTQPDMFNAYQFCGRCGRNSFRIVDVQAK